MKKIIIKQNEYLNRVFTIITFLVCIFLCGCAGDQKKMKKGTNEINTTEESTRDRTPNTPRINIPTHTF